MARLPDVAYRPVDLAASRPTARIDATPIAEGEAALAGAVGRSGEALARALQQSGNIGRVLEEAGGAQGRAVMEVGERIGRGLRKAGAEAGTAVIEGGSALAKATREAGALEAKGLAAFGTGLESIGKAAHEIKQRRDRFNLASALARFETGVNAFAIKYDQDTGFADLPQRYRADVETLRDEVAGTLDPELRDQFAFGSQRTVDRTNLAAWRRANSLEVSEGGKKLDTDLAQLLLARGSAFDSDPAGMIKRADELIGVAQNAGYVTPEEARQRQLKWLHAYGTAWSAAQPLDQRAAALQKRIGGERTGTPIDFVPPSVVVDLHKRTTVEVFEEKRRVESEAEVARQKLLGQLKQDVEDTAASGRGLGGLDAQTVERELGPAEAKRWLKAREDAQAFWKHTHDLSTMPEAEIAARLKTLELEGEISDRHKAIHLKVEKRASLIRRLRREDPARSVNDDPAVRAATQALDPQKLETFQPFAEARLAAQARAGIPEYARSVITRDEALRLTEPLVNAQPEQEQQVWHETVAEFQAMFGRHADSAFTDAMRAWQVDPLRDRLAIR